MAIKIKESKKGTFTKAAKKRGKGVQEFASQVLANKENYSPAMVKKANFAKNASKWKHEDGGELQSAISFDLPIEELGGMIQSSIEETLKQFALGGALDQQVGNQNQAIGSTVGNVAGMALTAAGIPGLGPVLSQLGSMMGKKSDEMKVLRDHFNSLNQSTNPYGNYANGGELEGLSGALSYSGASHDQGGIPVNADGIPSSKPIAEVEGGETVADIGGRKFVFSKKLKI